MAEASDHHHDHDHHHVHVAPEADLKGIGFDAFGVAATVSVPEAVVPRVAAILPPGAQTRPPREGDDHFILNPGLHGEFRVIYGAQSLSGSADLGVALDVLARRIREHVATNAPAHIFVHAGVVGHNGRAIVIPGLSFSGKTTLVAALVRAGATYYSDEFAVLDDDGLVHPYAKPLSIRDGGYAQTDHDVAALGGTQGVEPLPVGLVVVSWYETQAGWEPRRMSTGEAVLAVIANTIPVDHRPDQPLSAITKAVTGAVALEGPRGDAASVAAELLGALAAA